MSYGKWKRSVRTTAAAAALFTAAMATGTGSATAEDLVSKDDFNMEVLATGLDFPWGLTFLPDGDMLVTELAGTLRVIRDGKLDPEPVKGVPEAYRAGQGGLFDTALHPDFENNRLLYIIYAHGDRSANATRVARGTFDGAALSNVEVIFTTNWLKDTTFHYGGRMTFLSDGTLAFTIGDGSEYREMAQDLGNHIGTIIRINDDGSVPADNPFVDQAGAQPEIWSYGHRNPQGIYFDADSGTLYSNEHGPRGGDEINEIEKGGNYGWPIATYGIDYSGAIISPFTEYEGTIQPIVDWTPSIAPSALTMYRGDLFKGWDGHLLSTALAERSLRRTHMEDGKVVGETIMLKDMNTRLREVDVDDQGRIYILTDSNEGEVIRLTPKG